MENQEKLPQTDLKEYNHKYYLEHREKRRNKVVCDVCGRSVCQEYLSKHKTKLICLIKNGENVKIA